MSDELAERYRPQFPTLADSVHLISHSLGAMPARVKEYLGEYAELWARRSITAWEVWVPEIERAGDRLGRLMNAPAGSVLMNTNVSAIQAVLASCFDYTSERNEIVYDDMNFPSVSYVWKAEERRGARVKLVPSRDGIGVDVDELCAAISEKTVCVPISHVLFRSSFLQDAKKICARAREVGAYVILDTYQSLGTVPFDVVDLGVDFVCGGSVKWLCGGPGAAYLYVRPDLVPRFSPRVTGWFGHEKPFAFTMPEQRYHPGMWRYMGGTPAIAALYQARAGAEIIAEIGVDEIRAKSLRLTDQMIGFVDELGFRLNSPRDHARRGGSVIFDFDGAGAVAAELNRRRIFCDHRPGAGIRVSPHFYTKEEEIPLLFDEIKKIGKPSGTASSAY